MALKLPESARRLIDAPNLAHIATVMRDGSPQVSPVWVDRDGDFILINTGTKRLKLQNVRRDPRIAISIVDRERPFPPLLLRGRLVDIVPGQPAWEQFQKLAEKYNGRRAPEERRATEERLIWKIEVEHIRAPEMAPRLRD